MTDQSNENGSSATQMQVASSPAVRRSAAPLDTSDATMSFHAKSDHVAINIADADDLTSPPKPSVPNLSSVSNMLSVRNTAGDNQPVDNAGSSHRKDIGGDVIMVLLKALCRLALEILLYTTFPIIGQYILQNTQPEYGVPFISTWVSSLVGFSLVVPVYQILREGLLPVERLHPWWCIGVLPAGSALGVAIAPQKTSMDAKHAALVSLVGFSTCVGATFITYALCAHKQLVQILGIGGRSPQFSY